LRSAILVESKVPGLLARLHLTDAVQANLGAYPQIVLSF
jgi:hypothetical protein